MPGLLEKSSDQIYDIYLIRETAYLFLKKI